MLYLWPLFAFFSAPLIIPAAISSLTNLYKALAGLMSETHRSTSQKKAREPTSSSPTAILQIVDFLVSRAFYPCFLLGAGVVSVGIVKYNTIIHPFTLADNRHYMFYVFRYTILRSQLVRFSLIGAYMISAYLIWSRLAGCPPTSVGQDIHTNRPFDSNTLATQLKARVRGQNRPQVPPDKTSASPPTSTALLWLATTALSLISAPLVEPRYFILPWIFWRLLVPAWTTPANPPEGLRKLPGLVWLMALGRRIDLTVALETVWFVVVNLVTFWVFLSRPYQWRGVDGRMLDEARWQRFMW
jgi:alpha-1,2-glucosyltransferase